MSAPDFMERICIYCNKNPIPYLKDENGNSIGIQSTFVDNCDECSTKKIGLPIRKRGIKKGMKLLRNRFYRVVVIGGKNEVSGEQNILFTHDYMKLDRDALKEAKLKLEQLGGVYSTVYMMNRSTDEQYVVARFEWETVNMIVRRMGRRLLTEKLGD